MVDLNLLLIIGNMQKLNDFSIQGIYDKKERFIWVDQRTR
jgi:hypothetical protein